MKKLAVIASGIAGAGVIALGGVGVASAATANTNVGTSGIPRTVYKQERLDAVATVLNTSTANVQSARKAKTMSSLISSAGLTKKTFAQKVKAQLTTDLESKGYSQSQATIAMQRKTIHHLRHQAKSTKK